MSALPFPWRDTRGQTIIGIDKFLVGYEESAGGDAPPLLEALLREPAQNTLDLNPVAQNSPRKLSYDVIAAKAGSAWSDLAGSIEGSDLRVLRISNRNVPGLDGRVENMQPRGGYYNYMNFGGDSNKTTGGGAYGYGRSRLFRASAKRMILIDTVFTDETGRAIRRLVGVQLLRKQELEKIEKENPSTTSQLGRTGLRVWGPRLNELQNEDTVWPFEESATATTGDIAKLATQLELHRQTGDTAPGTDFYVVDFVSDSEDWKNVLQGAVYWNLWPAIMDKKIEVEVANEKVQLPDISTESYGDLWPIAEFMRLRKHPGAKQVGGCRAAAHPGIKVRTTHAKCLSSAIPGTEWFKTSSEAVRAVVRFRTNGLVVSYDGDTQSFFFGKDMTGASVADAKPREWKLGLVEVTDSALCGKLRNDGSVDGRVEDATHTKWRLGRKERGVDGPSLADKRRDFKDVYEALLHVAELFGIKREERSTTAIPGAEAASRFIAKKLGLFGTAPGGSKKTPGGTGGGGGGSGGASGKKAVLVPSSPEIVGGKVCAIFKTDRLEPGKNYAVTAQVETVAGEGGGSMPEFAVECFVRDTAGALVEAIIVNKATDKVYVVSAEGTGVSVELSPVSEVRK